jgi:acetoin utilization protein AcuC
MKTGFIYTDAYVDFDYGPTHPLKVIRLKLAYELIRAYGLLSLPHAHSIQPRKADEEDLAIFHSHDYLDALRQVNAEGFGKSLYQYGLGPGDNPIFEGLYDWSLWVTGATLQAAGYVAEKGYDIVFSIGGGLHHAQSGRASGFCYINDAVVAISKLVQQGKRIVYVDIDAHHGDGVQKAFYRTDRVLTVSLHETGHTLFPGTGFEEETGEGEGEGYSVNLPLPPFTADDVYVWAFEEVVPPLIEAFKPDLVFTQLGVDTFIQDPLANLHLSIFGFEKIVRRLKDLAPRWVALGGGGYDISNVARAWALAWAVMNDVELDEALPGSYVESSARWGVHEKRLREGFSGPSQTQDPGVRSEAERVVNYLKRNVFPKVRS